jgi:hypothetical protein
MKPKPLKIRSVSIGGPKPVFILGPCVIESERYDKANRTSVRSNRTADIRPKSRKGEKVSYRLAEPERFESKSSERALVRRAS